MTWKLSGYVIEECLGRGGSGTVWRARVARTGQLVALKRLPATDAVQLASARAEAAVLSALDHPHLIRLHEIVATSDASVLVLDLADAGSLADLLRRRGRLTPGEVVTALAPIGSALAYAHTQGVVHGDVSAANVLFTAIGLPLLADLGLARVIGDAALPQATPAYIDPIVANGHLPGPPTDVFGLAAVAVHALRGRSVWARGADGSGETAAEMIAQAAAALGAPIDVADLLPDAPESIRAVIGRALVASPHARCTAAEFALDLRHSLAPSPVELRAGRERTSVADLTAPRQRRFERLPADGPGAPDPGSEAVDPQADQYTYGTRLPPIGQLPRVRSPRRVRRPSGRMPRPKLGLSARRLRLGLVIGSAAAVALAAAFVLIRPVTGDDSTESARPIVTLAAATNRVDGPSSVPATTSAAPAPAAPVPRSSAMVSSSAEGARASALTRAADAVAVLNDLDSLRQRAFAERDAELLDQVYVAGALRAQDSATLTALVGPGCSLRGLHTVYSDVRLVPAATGSVAMTATAVLSPSTLICGSAPPTTVPGTAATPLRIELTDTAGRYLISTQQVL
jgi:hypothetical protein